MGIKLQLKGVYKLCANVVNRKKVALKASSKFHGLGMRNMQLNVFCFAESESESEFCHHAWTST